MASFDYLRVAGIIEETEDGMIAAVRVVLPAWANDQDEVKVSSLTGGITNALCLLSSPSSSDSKVVLRLYGSKTELFINRDWECRVFASLASADPPLAPSFHARWDNGRAEGFIENTAVLPDDMGVGDTQLFIADAVAALHAHKVVNASAATAGSSSFSSSSSVTRADGDEDVWNKLDKLFNLAKEVSFPEDSKKQAIVDALQLGAAREAFNALWQQQQQQQQQAHGVSPSASPSPPPSPFNRGVARALETVLTHGDLLSGNLLLRKDDGRCVVIDYEYAAHNERAWDVANHFTEYAGFDFEIEAKYPDEEVRLRFLCRYLAAARSAGASAGAGADAATADADADTDDEQQLLEEARGFDSRLPTFVLLSHLFWFAWAVAQARHSTSDFDYLEYAVVRRRGFDFHSEQYEGVTSATRRV